MQPRFSFVIVTYHNEHTIATCLSSIANNVTDPYEIVVVDNSSDNATLSAVTDYQARYPRTILHCHKTGQNIGFGRACNFGVSNAAGEYIFLLNPDTRLENDAASHLAACLETVPGAAAAGPAVLDEHGRLTRTCRNLPTLARILLDATGLDSWFGLYRLTHFPHDTARAVEQIIGAAILVRRSEYLTTGGMDEDFFIYFEEVDFCKRLQERGKSVWFWPAARVTHWHGSSCETDTARARMIYVLRESRTKYFRKHFSAFSARLLLLINRLEGIQKSCVLLVLFFLRRRPSHREKAKGFWAVATGSKPRGADAA